ncbi:MAG: sugar transferase [Leptolyngbyaceae cyanobacterium]
MTTFDEKASHAAITSVGDHSCIFVLPRAFTVVQAVHLKRECQQVFQQNPDLSSIVFDLSQTTFMDSSGLGALVGCWKLARNYRVPLTLKDVSPQIRSILTLADLTDLFHIHPIAQPEPAIVDSQRVQAGIIEQSPIPEPEFITHSSVHSIAKRMVDIVGALVGLSITGILFIPIAVAIKLDNPGPIFFGQTRCSWMGRRFKMWKFRSMVADAETLKHLIKNEASGAIFKNANDPRITRVGKFLRKTSLDELPQFWNVLKGEMSLVGTRPPTPDEVLQYDIPHWQRLDIKPGMTGEWQVNGRSSISNFEDIVQFDLRYQENWSLFYDLQLILRTIVIIFHKNSGAS